MSKPWDNSRWPRRPTPDDEPDIDEHEPSEPEPSATELLASNRDREYERGRRYEVWVPGPFAKVNPKAMPTLAIRYFVRWESSDNDEREPVFATEEEWLELRLDERVREETDALRVEGFEAPEPWMTFQEIADQVGASVRTIRRHVVERGECPFTEFGRTKKVRRSDFEEWLKKDLPVTKEIREVDSYRREDF